MALHFKKFQIKTVLDPKGTYSFCEPADYGIDWPIEKVYFLQGIKQATGQHCHKEERELFVLVKGSCTAIIDQGNGKEDIPMTEIGDAIDVGNYVWHGFKDFSEDSVLLALSSKRYVPDRSDYIEDYEEYRKIIESMA